LKLSVSIYCPNTTCFRVLSTTDPLAEYLVREGEAKVRQTSAMLWVQAIALICSIIIGMMTFTGSMIACFKLRGTIASKPRIVPFRWGVTLILFAAMIVLSALSFTGGQTWNDRGLGLAFICIVAVLAGIYGIIAVMAIGTYFILAFFWIEHDTCSD
jgi:NAD/NADP transhydrogenase beta subunit